MVNNPLLGAFCFDPAHLPTVVAQVTLRVCLYSTTHILRKSSDYSTCCLNLARTVEKASKKAEPLLHKAAEAMVRFPMSLGKGDHQSIY